jgi:hypothetical protein
VGGQLESGKADNPPIRAPSGPDGVGISGWTFHWNR